MTEVEMIKQDVIELQHINARHELNAILKTGKLAVQVPNIDVIIRPIPIYEREKGSLLAENSRLKSSLHQFDYVRNMWDSYIDTLQTVADLLEKTELEVEELRIRLGQD